MVRKAWIGLAAAAVAWASAGGARAQDEETPAAQGTRQRAEQMPETSSGAGTSTPDEAPAGQPAPAPGAAAGAGAGATTGGATAGGVTGGAAAGAAAPAAPGAPGVAAEPAPVPEPAPVAEPTPVPEPTAVPGGATAAEAPANAGAEQAAPAGGAAAGGNLGGLAAGGGRTGTSAQSQRKTVGELPPPAEEVQAMLAPEPELVGRTRVANQQLGAAGAALASGDLAGAESALVQANEVLADLYTRARGSELARNMGQTAWQLRLPTGSAVDLQMLVSQVQALKNVLSPEVVARVQVAAAQQRRGDPAGAAQALLTAREWLANDLSLVPIEEAYARGRAALAELQAGNPEVAQSLLMRVGLAMADVQRTAPLVPVRLNLRAAAAAAEDRQWAEAERWVNQAGEVIGSLQSDAPPVLRAQLATLSSQVAGMQERLASGTQPRAQQFRRLAEAAGGVPVG